MNSYQIVFIASLSLLGCTTPAPQSVGEKETTQPHPAKAAKYKLPEKIEIAGKPFLGNAQAPITIVAFTDYQCQYCSHFSNNTLPLLEQEYIETGQLKYVLLDLPYEKNHPLAKNAALATHCADEQQKFWPMHNLLFADQYRLDINSLNKKATLLGLNIETFQSCIKSGNYVNEINKDIQTAKSLGVQATPTFFFGFTSTEDDSVLVKGVITGSQPYETFQYFIKALLKKAASDETPPL